MSKPIEQRDYAEIRATLTHKPTELMREAGDHDMNLSQFLNASCPAVLLDERRSITNKLTEDLGFVVRGSSFVKASTYEDFAKTPAGRALAYDYLYRNYFRTPDRSSTIMFPTSNTETLFPDGVSVPRFEDELPARFDPNTLIAITTPVEGSTYKVFRWKGEEDDVKRERVMPGSKLPKMQLTEQEAPVNLYKWGIAAELTYEAIRRLALDKVGAMLMLEMNVERRRQLSQYITVLKDGDERDGQTASDGTVLNTKAVSVTRASVDSAASPGEITLKGLMNYFAGWPQGYACNYIMCRASRAVDIALLTTGSTNIPISFLTNVSAPGIPGFLIPGIGGTVTVLIADDDDVGANEIVGVDSGAALERLDETGSSIREQAIDIENQTQLMTFSDNYGLAKLITATTRVLNLT